MASSGKDKVVLEEHRSFARIGFLGNPSDVYFGRTISFTIGNFWASAKLEPSDHLLIKPHPFHDLVQFPSLDNLSYVLWSEFFFVFLLCIGSCSVLKARPVPRRRPGATRTPGAPILDGVMGLSGSSAIVSAALSCLLDFYNVRQQIKIEVRPNLILNAEKELGIVAGLQDRVAQVYGGGLVHMDFSKEHMDKVGYGIYTIMDINLLPPLHLIYAENPSDSGKVREIFTSLYIARFVEDG
ncbi:unnamed protein product [Arabis nemorensis]|uniref:Uncharacterized protein n=1 Tax=Arabis nemorensis TaxID=586526 RepID=A0A565CLD8_9BRAS|nr:unnamed protein product [Arabis nemorensis]